jgi:hypothetical protein
VTLCLSVCLSVCLLLVCGGQVVMAYTVGMAGALLALQAVPAEAKALQWIAIAALGFTIYGRCRCGWAHSVWLGSHQL